MCVNFHLSNFIDLIDFVPIERIKRCWCAPPAAADVAHSELSLVAVTTLDRVDVFVRPFLQSIESFVQTEY